MSPVSRGRKPTKKTTKSSLATERRQLLKTVLADADDALAERDPVEVELIASTILGDLWQPAGAEHDVLLPLIDDAARRPSPAARALLRMIEHLGLTEAQRTRAAAAADAFTAMPEPPWGEALGAVVVDECWQQADVFGDGAALVLRCRLGGKPHGLVAEVDFSGGGLGDLYLIDNVDEVVDEMRAGQEASEVMVTEPVPPARARRILEDAIAVNESVIALLPPAVAEEDPFAPMRALVAARLRAMPPADPVVEPETFGDDERDELVGAFLAESGEVTGDLARSVRIIVDFGCDDDLGQPLRVGPGKFEVLLDHVLWAGETSDDVLEGLLIVLPSWARWAGARSGLAPSAIDRLLEELEEIVEEFRARLAEYRDDFDHETESAVPIALRRP
ncbi:hypothetical protein GCM10027445_38980 [Amycolatopsis endophytica]|uniref:Uncharacterized protein n=1 Tax=Amycolatopsis endophytica TaxID=860233 RepID=A0A853B032_9PSEU|nr:hypothetical protein [Amycolatopsis endophytica]NYI88262.1 hypothetical protein [Amycolatopsis endophytica]